MAVQLSLESCPAIGYKICGPYSKKSACFWSSTGPISARLQGLFLIATSLACLLYLWTCYFQNLASWKMKKIMITFLTYCDLNKSQYFADKISKLISSNDNHCIMYLIIISLKFVQKGPLDNKSSFVQDMTYHWNEDEPLPELMMTNLNDATPHH